MLKRQDGTAVSPGGFRLAPWFVRTLWGGHTSTCFSSVVTGQWARYAWLWFQRPELQQTVLCGRASRQNHTFRGESGTLLFWCFLKKVLTKGGKRKESLFFCSRFYSMVIEGRQRTWKFLCVLSCQLKRLLWWHLSLPTSTNQCTKAVSQFLLMINFFSPQCQRRDYFSCSLLFTKDFFHSKKCSRRHCQQMGTEEPCWAGMQGVCRSQAQTTAGSAEEEGNVTLREQSQSLHEGWHPLHTVWDRKQSPPQNSYKEAPSFGVTGG